MKLFWKLLNGFLYITLLLCSTRGCQLVIEPSSLSTAANVAGKSSAVCFCSNSPNYNYKFTWYRHGRLLVNTNRVELEVTSPDRIFFRRILVEDEGEYICVATKIDNSLILNTSLMVYVAPQLADNVESRHLSIGVGSSLELPCPVKSLEQHSTLSLIWILPSRNRLSVDNQQSGNFNFVQDSNTLLMRDARLSDTGEYQCYASNLAGRVTFIWNISVKDFIRRTVPQTDQRLTIATNDATSLSRTTTEIPPLLYTTISSLLASPLYLTLIIIAFIITCALILITVIISITCICFVCSHSKLSAEDTSEISAHKNPPLPEYSTCMTDYIQKTPYPHHGPSPATSCQSLGSTRRITNAQPPFCIVDTTSLESPNGQTQNLLTPSSFKHMRYLSDQGEYHSQAELACPRCCPSVTMSEPRSLYANSPRLTPRLQPKKHSLPDRIEDHNCPHPLTQTQYGINTPYLQFPTNAVQQVEV